MLFVRPGPVLSGHMIGVGSVRTLCCGPFQDRSQPRPSPAHRRFLTEPLKAQARQRSHYPQHQHEGQNLHPPPRLANKPTLRPTYPATS
ncbi:hypothetical protein BT67DRAFT_38843 [Trichocladium antarcticum]|uniref:Uncharacterized protein n=1 Tax=Trichocladium antarcticum TaxID=1450529 RepID=A0AAN6UL03_9PEZI|nr:hypothetical protein BT67DRAFT_38843 [Trichocladium antarcticum]